MFHFDLYRDKICLVSNMISQIFYKIKSLYANHWWLCPLTIFILWRIILEIVGHLAFSLQPNIVSPWSNNPYPPLWARWDSGWYYSIVNYGYSLKTAGGMSNVTFFPLFPLLWKIVELITSLKGFAVALFLNNILTLFSFLVFYRWVQEKWNKQVAFKSLLALTVFPTSFFFISAYSEAILFLCIVIVLLFCSRRRWILAALIAALASAARPTGILIWPLVFWLWWSSNIGQQKSSREFLALLFLPPLGLILFSLYLYYKTGNALIWFSAQSSAGRGFVWPINLLWAYTKNILTLGNYWPRHLAEMMALFFPIFLLPMLRKIHPAYVFYTVLNLLPSFFSNTLTSIQRFVLIIAPLFVVMGLQKKWFYILYFLLSGILLFYSIVAFIAFRWAG